MFCISTGNNTVNMIPVLQFGIGSVFIISTKHSQDKGWTKRLLKVMKDYEIVAEPISIDKNFEKNVIALADDLVNNARNNNRIVWNITGGQKIPILAFHMAFRERIDNGFKEDVILYMEASPPEICCFGSDYKIENISSDASLSLSNILHLYGSEIVKDDILYPVPSDSVLRNLQTGRQALKYFMEHEWFREIFFKSMKSDVAFTKTKEDVLELVRRSLDSLKPTLSEIKLTSTGYEDFVNEIDGRISKIKNGVISSNEKQKMEGWFKILSKPSVIYNDYWNSIKKQVVDGVLENIEHKREKMLLDPINEENKKNIISSIRSIGGVVEDFRGNLFYKNDLKRLSTFRTGILFEWMVASYIVDVIQQNECIKNKIVSVHMGVETRKAGDPNAKVDTEIDIVITTKFGTLLFLEMKAHEFSGDIVKSKESTAYKKSGPYGKVVMIGPLLKSMVKEKENGEKVYPHYIDGKIKDMKETAEQNNVQYVYIDGIEEMLKKELFCSE